MLAAARRPRRTIDARAKQGLNARSVEALRSPFFGVWAVVLACAFTSPAETLVPALLGRDAPLFSGRDQDGSLWRLADYLGKQLIFLYFYPRDDSADCTSEACGLRDNMAAFRQAGVEVAGVSFDTQESHKNFIFKYNLDFPLLADTDGAIADAYGARVDEFGVPVTSVITAGEIKDYPGLINKWRGKADPVSAYFWNSLSKLDQALLRVYDPSSPDSEAARKVVLQAIQKAIRDPGLHKSGRFKGITLRAETSACLKLKLKGPALARLNRALLEDAYPTELSRRANMDRRVSFLIGLDGKIIHITDSPDPAAHIAELVKALAVARSGNRH